MSRFPVVALVMIASGMPSAGAAQPLGVFRWQQQPYCKRPYPERRAGRRRGP